MDAASFFHDLIENVNDLVHSVRSDGSFQFVNRAWRETLGYTIEEVARMNVFDVVHPDFQAPVRDLFRRVLAGERLANVEFALRAKDGRTVWVEGSTNCRFESGQPIATRTVLRDVSDRRLTEEALRRSEERYRLAVEAVTGIVYDWDTMTGRIDRSPGLRGVLGYRPEDIPDNSPQWWVDLIHPDDLDGAYAALNAALTERDSMTAEYRVRHKAGHYVPLWEHAVIVRDGTGRPVRIVGCALDVTDRVRAEAERRQLEARMLQAQNLESLGLLAGGVAHDFNNLLTGILGFAAMARAELPPNAPVAAHLEEVEKATLRAADLARQMLAYSGRGVIVAEPVALDELVREMCRLLRTVVSRKATIRAEAAPATVQGDPTQLRQVVMNLITNASDALGEAEGTVTVRTGVRAFVAEDLHSPYLHDERPAGEYAFVRVEDGGCGMDPATMARVFDPFFTTKFTGRGLGLAAVLGIVRGHKGTIHVTSEPGQGSAFEVRVPKLDGPLVVAGAAGETTVWSGRGTVLVADDEESIRRWIGRLLSLHGFAVVLAADGREAVEALERDATDVVAAILDLTMPRSDGLEAARQIRQRWPQVRVMVMSGFGEQEALLRGIGKDVDTFLAKPFRPVELTDQLRRLLEPIPPA